MSVVEVRGEPRLSIDDYASVAWSPDGTRLAVADRKALAIWRTHDAALLELMPYRGRDVSVSSTVWSRDGRWIALGGTRHQGGTDVAVQLLADLADAPQLHVIEAANDPGGFRATATRLLSPAEPLTGRGATVRITAKHDAVELVDAAGSAHKLADYDLESALAVVDGGARLEIARPGELAVYDLPAGTLVKKVPLPGSEMVMISPDGKRVAGWTLGRVVLLDKAAGAPPAAPRALPTPFLAVWDVATGAQLWQDTTRCCDTWDFSGDGQWLVPPWHRLGSELVAAANGHVVTYPGRVLSVSPDGSLAAIGTRDGLALWTTAGRPAVAPAHGPVVAARGANGAVVELLAATRTLSRGIVIDLGTGAAVLEVSHRCTTVFAERQTSDEHAFAFSADGSRLYAARWSAAGTDAAVVRVDDGQQLHAIHTSAAHRVTIAPALARFVFDVGYGVRIVDALAGREVGSAPAPRVTYSRGPGLVWDERDPDGERTSHLGSLVATADLTRVVGSTDLRGEVVTIWDLRDVRRTIDLPVPGIISAVAVSSDGAHIAAGDRDGNVTAWTGADHSKRVFPGSHDWIRALAVSPDDKLLATASDDGTVTIIDLASGTALGGATLVADKPTLLTWLDARTLAVDSSRRLAITLSVR